MARLVAAFGSSHSIMLTAERDDWLGGVFRDSDRRMELYDRQGVRRSYEEMLALAGPGSDVLATQATLTAAHEKTFAAVAKLKWQFDAMPMDALIIVGDDQKELFSDAMMPSLAIYYGETIRNAAQKEFGADTWYARAQRRRLEPEEEAHYPVDSSLALHLIDGLMRREFDICAMAGLNARQFEGHAYSYIHRAYLGGRVLPVVPILLNTYYPPTQITPHRCVNLGLALRALIQSYPGRQRIGIVASGGLSHFMVDEEIDRGVMAALAARDLDYLAHLDVKRLQAGSSEIRSWIVTAAAASDLHLKWMEYIPTYRTPALTGTGLGFAYWS